MTRSRIAVFLSSLLGIALLFFFWNSEEEIDFSTQIKPILNTHCISCHGGVKKNGGFSVLFEEEAFAITESGHPAIIPGDPNGSELIRRLSASDPEMRMPYQRSPLSEDEIQLLKTWIKQGAKWGKHWAYEPLTKPRIPSKAQAAGINSEDGKENSKPIDYFIRKKLAEKGLEPAEPEKPSKLLRRVSLDLTGLPPSKSLSDAYLSGKISYDILVDSLLAANTFGEKWASWWLDLARYADTKGYERDVTRTMWPYRDWVIRAFNEDKPFDEFTIEQLAGDLLPNPTIDQLTATAFHRNTMNNDEGGTQDEEFRVAAVLDRVNTTYEVWQSTTMACVQCHSHPYDPIRHEEYYQSMAFFNNSRDEDTHDEEPRLRFYEAEEKEKLNQILEWVKTYESNASADSRKDFLTFLEPKYPAHNFEDFTEAELVDTKWLGLRSGGSAYLKDVDTRGADQLLINYRSGLNGSIYTLRKDGPTGEILSKFTLNKTQGDSVFVAKIQPISGKNTLFLEMENRTAKTDQTTGILIWLAFVPSLEGKDQPGFKSIQNSWNELIDWNGTRLPIMSENPDYMKRTSHVFERGNWLLEGDAVLPAPPAALNPWEKEGPQDRMGLALWLTAKENPLTARTLVNRIWDQLFGRGLVSTIEDLGTQSDPPSHPELLDYLAWQTMDEYDWSMKALIREIVTSETYQQSATLDAELFNLDPQNKWYARGPRIRLSAEQIRDQALATSGLLSKKMFGKPVMPPQPDGIWQTVYNGESWIPSEGEDKYRRGIYTFLKRTSPYPSFISFDAGSREVCQSRRIVTNTPLQALVTLNDPVYLEAAFSLGQGLLSISPTDPKQAIRAGYEQLFFSSISDSKLNSLNDLYQTALMEFESEPEILDDFFQLKEENISPEMAAMTIVANALMNLDEFLTKP